MWPTLILVDSPRFNLLSRIVHRHEHLRIQTLTSKSPVETLNHRILQGFSRSDKIQLHLVGISPGIQCSEAHTLPPSTVMFFGYPHPLPLALRRLMLRPLSAARRRNRFKRLAMRWPPTSSRGARRRSGLHSWLPGRPGYCGSCAKRRANPDRRSCSNAPRRGSNDREA